MKTSADLPHRVSRIDIRFTILAIAVTLIAATFLHINAVQANTRNSSACVYSEPTLEQKWGTLTYVNYDFKAGPLTSLEHEVVLHNTPDPTIERTTYIQLYDAAIGGRAQYFGLQTHGMAIWSQWGASPDDVRTIGDSYTVIVEGEDNALSLRRDFPPMHKGHYKTRIERAEFDGIGDWFNYFVTLPDSSEELIGGMRFPRSNVEVPAVISDGGGQWNEFARNNFPELSIVEYMKLDIRVTGNKDMLPKIATGKFSSMPNAEITSTNPGGYITTEFGGTTARCRDIGPDEAFILWDTSVVVTTTQPPVNLAPTGPSGIWNTELWYDGWTFQPCNWISKCRLNLAWTAAQDDKGVVKYVITRTVGKSTITIDVPGNLTSYSDTGVSGGYTYKYKVTAVDAEGKTSLGATRNVSVGCVWILCGVY